MDWEMLLDEGDDKRLGVGLACSLHLGRCMLRPGCSDRAGSRVLEGDCK